MRLKTYVLNVLRYLDAAIFDHVGPVRVLFVVRNRIGLAHQLPLIRGLAAQPGFKVAVARERTCPASNADIAIHLNNSNAKIISGFLAPLLKWHYTFFTDVRTNRFLFSSTIVMINHGNTWGNFDKEGKYGWDGRFDDYPDFLAHGSRVSLFHTYSAEHLRGFEQRFPYFAGSPTFRPLILGIPKFDFYPRPSPEERRDGLANLGLDPRRPTAVLTSHWTPKAVLSSLGFDAIDAVLRHPSRLNVILLGHEKLWTTGEDGSNQKARDLLQAVRERLKTEDRLRFFPYDLDIAQYLGLADFFLCDNSSVFVECLLFDRPILFFAHPRFEFFDPKIGDCYRSASEAFSTAEELATGVDKALANPQLWAEERRRALEFMLARPGNATTRAIDLFVRMGRVSGPHSLRWPRATRLIDEFNATTAAHADWSRHRVHG